jgi:hypothetical protein
MRALVDEKSGLPIRIQPVDLGSRSKLGVTGVRLHTAKYRRQSCQPGLAAHIQHQLANDDALLDFEDAGHGCPTLLTAGLIFFLCVLWNTRLSLADLVN